MAVFEKKVNVQCGIGSISMLISSHIHKATNCTIAKNSWQSYFKKFSFLENNKWNKDWLENVFLHFLPPLYNANDFSSG